MTSHVPPNLRIALVLAGGNAPADRLSRLSDLWRPDSTGAIGASAWDGVIDSWRRSGEAIATLFGGRRGLFAPLGTALAERDTPALYDTTPLAHTLARLFDFDRLNDGRVRYMVQAVALDTGAEVVFDNARGRIAPDHVRANCAMPPAFPRSQSTGNSMSMADWPPICRWIPFWPSRATRRCCASPSTCCHCLARARRPSAA